MARTRFSSKCTWRAPRKKLEIEAETRVAKGAGDRNLLEVGTDLGKMFPPPPHPRVIVDPSRFNGQCRLCHVKSKMQ
eukprot:9295047-Pyramimonas_sp.AAC.1